MIRVLLFATLGIVAACGGGGGDDDGRPTLTPSPSPSVTVSPAGFGQELCSLLSKDDIAAVTGYERGLTQPHDGPGTLHFCTVYLKIDACNGHCALSIDDLGEVSENNTNTPELFRQTLQSANPDASMEFTDGVLGENSWLATISTTDLPDWKIVYFQVNGVAFDLDAPRVRDYTLTAEQMTELAKRIIDKLAAETS